MGLKVSLQWHFYGINIFVAFLLNLWLILKTIHWKFRKNQANVSSVRASVKWNVTKMLFFLLFLMRTTHSIFPWNITAEAYNSVIDVITTWTLLPLALFHVIRKACVRYFLFFHQMIVLQKLKNASFSFIWKAIYILEIFKFLYFFPFIFTLSRFKRSNESGIIYDAMNCLLQSSRCNFWNNAKAILYCTIKLG